jgi:uncharacterized membrane-anchored protein YhcB (DUF1043 family)
MADDYPAGPIDDSFKHCATASQRFQPQQAATSSLFKNTQTASSSSSHPVAGKIPHSTFLVVASLLLDFSVETTLL